MTIPPDALRYPVAAALDDLAGEPYTTVLARLHAVLRPTTYLEIGTHRGTSLALASCASIAIDPKYHLDDPALHAGIFAKPALSLYRMTSDAFFARTDPTAVLGAKIDMAFLDGMHRCEFLLRDFANVERHCRRNSVIALHDCLPVEPAIAGRTHHDRLAAPVHTSRPYRHNWWTGDVWRAALLLKRARPDLRITTVDAALSGLVLITNLDPASTTLTADYARHVEAMLSWRLDTIGIGALFAELGIEPTTALATEEQITARFWL